MAASPEGSPLSALSIYSFEGIVPVVDPRAYVHPDAVLIGDVIIGPDVYIGPLASLRGDFGRIVIESGANVQDCCVLHGYPGADTLVAENASVGHGAVVHSAHVGPNSLVGMNSVVMDNARIGAWCVIAAMSFVRAETIVPDGKLLAGVPAKILRDLTETERAWKIVGRDAYRGLAARSAAGLAPAVALAAPEPGRRRIDWNDVNPLSVMKRGLASRADPNVKDLP